VRGTSRRTFSPSRRAVSTSLRMKSTPADDRSAAENRRRSRPRSFTKRNRFRLGATTILYCLPHNIDARRAVSILLNDMHQVLTSSAEPAPRLRNWSLSVSSTGTESRSAALSACKARPNLKYINSAGTGRPVGSMAREGSAMRAISGYAFFYKLEYRIARSYISSVQRSADCVSGSTDNEGIMSSENLHVPREVLSQEARLLRGYCITRSHR
jgi:hypothetical protein